MSFLYDELNKKFRDFPYSFFNTIFRVCEATNTLHEGKKSFQNRSDFNRKDIWS